MQKLRLGTRGSTLAVTQSRHVAHSLQKYFPDLQVEEIIIKTTGDMRSLQYPLLAPQLSSKDGGGKGAFTKEIEHALLHNEIDFAVHSQKDLPPQMPEDLILAAIPARETAADMLVSQQNYTLETLPQGARVGTSSLRRQSQLLHLAPQCSVLPLRGNIDTRLRKLDEGQYDAIIVAGAALNRLNIRRGIPLNEEKFVPAPAQGALAIQSREGDKSTFDLLRAIDDAHTRCEIAAERAVVETLDAGCSTPLGARAILRNDDLHLWAVVLSPDGKHRLFAEAQGELCVEHRLDSAQLLGQKVAEHLLQQGARAFLQ